MTPVRWAIAGYGAGGRVFHSPMIEAVRGLELVAVVSTNRLRGQQAAERGLLVVEDVKSLPELGVEGVTIATPAGTHVDLAHQALACGMHVVVDKPFALDGVSARAVVEHARSVGRVLTVYQNRRWDGDFRTLSSLVRSGKIGRVRRFTSRIERFRPNLPRWNTRTAASEGGGTLVDLGPHLIDQAICLFGRVESVYAELSTFDPEALAEDDVMLSLEHWGGVMTTIIASRAAAAQGPRFQVNGDLGGAWVEGFDIQEHDLMEGRTPLEAGLKWGQEPDSRKMSVRTERGSMDVPLEQGRWQEFYPAVALAVRDGSPVPVDPSDAVHTCEVFDAARASHEQEGRVYIPRM